MFYVGYMLAELRRRLGRTLVTAFGLAVGIGLVITVSALSSGLDDAQAKVLAPLTGVGTDLSVSRTINIDPRTGPQGLSEADRRALREEVGGARFGLRQLGEPGTKFSRDDFLPTGRLSFPDSRVSSIRSQSGVKDAAGSLTLNAVHIEGTVPEQPAGPPGTFNAPAPGPRSIDFDSRSVTGMDTSHPALAAVTPAQIVSGRYLSKDGEAVLNQAYAKQHNLSVGDKVKFGSKTFTVVGLAQTPVGGQASDVYVKLAELQALADRKGRVERSQRARRERRRRAGGGDVDRRRRFAGATVTTAEDLAGRVSGSLVDARKLADRLGTALVIVALLAAFLIASLLTLSSVAKRTRELGTLKALGWRQWLVVRQVAGESVLQGVLGGLLGIALGVLGALAIQAASPTLEASFAQAAQQGPRFIGPGGFGQGDVASASTSVDIGAPISFGLALAAVGLAVLGGLIAGGVGGLRAARLRPADALRHID